MKDRVKKKLPSTKFGDAGWVDQGTEHYIGLPGAASYNVIETVKPISKQVPKIRPLPVNNVETRNHLTQHETMVFNMFRRVNEEDAPASLLETTTPVSVDTWLRILVPSNPNFITTSKNSWKQWSLALHSPDGLAPSFSSFSCHHMSPSIM